MYQEPLRLIDIIEYQLMIHYSNDNLLFSKNQVISNMKKDLYSQEDSLYNKLRKILFHCHKQRKFITRRFVFKT